MFKKASILLFFVFSLLMVWGQESPGDKNTAFGAENTKQVDAFIGRKSLDSAYRYLQGFEDANLEYYLAWKTLAYAYWNKGDLANSSAIAFWIKNKALQFDNPNELYPQAHHLVGNFYFSQRAFDSAIANYKRTIEYRQHYTHPFDTMLVDTYQNLSQIYSLQADSSNTFTYLEKARDIVYLKSNNTLEIASVFARYADSYTRLGHYKLAERYYQEALGILDTSIRTHQYELYLLYRQKARLSYFLGKFSESINLYSRSLYWLNELEGSALEREKIIEDVADAYYMLKDYENALEQYRTAYDLVKGMFSQSHSRIINLNTDLASVYKNLEDYKQAIYHFRLAELYGKLSSYQYRVFGETYWKADSLDKAQPLLEKANTMAENRNPINIKELADAQFLLGTFNLKTGRNPDLGLYYLNRAVGGYRTVLGAKNEPLGRTLLAEAHYFLDKNQTGKALEIMQESIIALSPGFNSANILMNPDGVQLSTQSITNTLGWKAYALARHYENTQDLAYLKMSFKTYQLALKMIEGFRLSQKYSSNLILNKEVNNLLDQAILVSNKLYGLTDDKYYFDATFSFIEQNKSTALLASLQGNDSIRLANVPTPLIEQENQLKQELLGVEEKINTVVTSTLPKDQKLAAMYEQQKFNFQHRLDSVQASLALNYPEYYRLFYGNNAIEIADVQKQLKSNKVLLDYALTDSLLLVYVISKEKAALYTKKIPPGFSNSMLRLLQLIRYVNTEQSNADFQAYTRLAYSFYQLLLADLAEDIKGKELLIVPDGILSYLPFEVLLTEPVHADRPNYYLLPYFIRNQVSSTLNSAAIYFSYAQKKQPNYGQIIAFAPSYSIFDTLDYASEDRYSLMPLPHVGEELKSISNLFSPKIFKGDKATKSNFMEYASDASVLHLAMHAVLNDEEPLQSELVFAPDNSNYSSGLFTVGELFGMELSADLAVLSACNSGNGKLNKGEGIMSLSTGFQYAGVPSVVMTHWDVNDKYSADLMSGFYTYLAQGMEKNKALHKAKMDLLNSGSPLYSHPYYWAGFTLIGNENAVVSRKSVFGHSLQYVIPVLVLLFLFLRKKEE